MEDPDSPYIYSIDPGSDNEIIFPGEPVFQYHTRELSKNNMDIKGKNFPENTTIFILVYQGESGSESYKLISKQSVFSDSTGLFAVEAPILFLVDQSYIVIWVSNPNTQVQIGGYFDKSLPYEYFKVVPLVSISDIPNTTSSCPGAPPQRMVVGQLGFVCTKSDNVRLRNSPNRSSSLIDSLPVGTPFTVLDGPSCADNWSWWQIETDYGTTGWIAEGGDEIDPYFICPLP